VDVVKMNWFQQEFTQVGSSSCHFRHKVWLSYERQRRIARM
jgi:hypothetical protein